MIKLIYKLFKKRFDALAMENNSKIYKANRKQALKAAKELSAFMKAAIDLTMEDMEELRSENETLKERLRNLGFNY